MYPITRLWPSAGILLAVAFACTVFTLGATVPRGERALFLIEGARTVTADALLSAGVPVVGEFDGGWLAAGDPDDLSCVERLGLRYKILGPVVTGEAYYTVYVRDEEDWETAGSLAGVLARKGSRAVLRASQEEAEALAAQGIELARVFLTPMRPRRTVAPDLVAAPMDADPWIHDMVAATSIARIDSTVQRLQNFVTRYSMHDSCRAAGEWIRSEFESFGIDSVVLRPWSADHSPNVVAVLPGSGHPEKIVIIGGHYDSITANHESAPGADDNASGTACVLECARILSQCRFDYTIVFIAFSGEELGLLGSEAYAAAAAARGDDIVGMVAVDMIGYVAPGDAIDLDVIDNPYSAWLRDRVMQAASLYVPGFAVVHGSLTSGSSDHASFWRNGYDAILFHEDIGQRSPYIHTTNDVVGLSYVNHALAEGAIKTAVAFIADLARPFRVAIAHTPLPHTEDETNPYRVAARIVSAQPLDPSSLTLWYKTGPDWNSLDLLPAGAPDEYEAYIPAQAAGSVVDYYLVAEDIDGTRAVDPETAPADAHAFAVGTLAVAFQDDFESETGWTVGAPGDDATMGIWERGDPNATYTQPPPVMVQPENDHSLDPGVACYITANSPVGSAQAQNDVDDGKTTLLSPVIDLSSCTNAWVSYYRWYSNDTGPAPASDTLTVDVSPDSGLTWYRLEATHLSQRSWHFAEHDLLRYIPLTGHVRFRFVASDDEPESIVEAAIDDFTIVTYRSATTSVPGDRPPSAALRLDQNFPNPFNPETTIRFDVPAPGEIVSLKVYDVAGRMVGTLLEGERVAGARTVRWDGRDHAGRRVPSGVYFYRLEAGGQSLSRKLIVVR